MSHIIIHDLEEALAAERSRIVGLCASLTNNIYVAEDLAQEVLFAAWRGSDRLQNRQNLSPWLSGIARNICLRWLRQQKRLASQLASAEQAEQELASLADSTQTIEVELERQELAELLDQALDLLSPTTRELLVARYVEQFPLHEVAARFGLQSSTAAMRLQRGKLVLQRSLQDTLNAQEYVPLVVNTWKETPLWCTSCGQHRLLCLFRPVEASLWLDCPACGKYGRTNFFGTEQASLFLMSKRIKPAIHRLRNWLHSYYRSSLDTLSGPCLRCGLSIPLLLVASITDVMDIQSSPVWSGMRGAYQYCPTCQIYNWASLQSLVLALPEGQQFIRAHPRIRALPELLVEVDGLAACVTRFVSVTDPACFEVVSALDSFRVLRIEGRVV